MTMTNLSFYIMLYTMKIVAEILPEKRMFKILSFFYKKTSPVPTMGGKNVKTIP